MTAPAVRPPTVRSSILAFRLGDREVEVLVRPLETLQAVLREGLGQWSVKEGCRQGGCGSCTVLVDGRPMPSCLLPAEEVEGCRVDTIETLTPVHGLLPLQQAFVDAQATQCGYCTPGMLLAATSLLAGTAEPNRGEIADAIVGNVCRCTGYEPILAAIEAAAIEAAGRDGRSATGGTAGPAEAGDR